MDFKNYDDFIKSKAITITAKGFDVNKSELNPVLFDFQKDIVRWALGKGKAAIFADCGDGKTAMQLEWAEQIRKRTGGKVIIIAPLAVSAQTKREGEKFGIEVNICSAQSDATKNAVHITNYEKLDKFIASEALHTIRSVNPKYPKRLSILDKPRSLLATTTNGFLNSIEKTHAWKESVTTNFAS